MKKIILLIVLCMPLLARAQRIFVEPNPRGYEQPIINKLIEEKYKVVFKSDSADITIKCMTSAKKKYRAIGYLLAVSPKDGTILGESKRESARSNYYNGLEDPEYRMMRQLANKELKNLLYEISSDKKM
ncbi:hypothetical protein F0L74_17500 [Chitinophaga agrisoli]|uniref:Uncharacterized protein n=1 Tax=Chitinophaga agrisoli TaxID=2607653 RepID=A0A5B2VPJ8_9BACT|nr:hypothetical protein [Chitinophaga agrisoli]KAA2241673.1 hypothetical protein F0L74_17500 [Chitinophaga agrisoli]